MTDTWSSCQTISRIWPKVWWFLCCFLASCAQKLPPSSLCCVAKWGMGSESGKQKPEPSVVLSSSSMCFVQWRVLCFILGNPRETHATGGADDLRLRKMNQTGDLDSWCIFSPVLLMEHFSCPPTAWTITWPLLLMQMKTYFVPSVAACFSFPFCLVYFFFFSSPASSTFLAQLLAVTLGLFSLFWAPKLQINLQLSRNRQAG